MIDKICEFLTNRIRKEMPEIDDDRAAVINYGLQNIIGELPKTFLLFIIAFFLGMLKEVLFMLITFLPYREASGGFHLKTHIGCIIGTTLFFCGTVFLAKIIVIESTLKYIITVVAWGLGMIMIKLYAPADTENVPILCTKDRRKKKIISYITFSVGLLVSVFIKDNFISNILLLENIVQTLTITKIAYRLTNNKYGYEVYNNTSTQTV